MLRYGLLVVVTGDRGERTVVNLAARGRL